MPSGLSARNVKDMAIPEVLEELRKSFQEESDSLQRERKILERWPKITDSEYIEVFPFLWVTDLIKQNKLCTMPYGEFLKTQYWRAISKQRKKDHPWCDGCFEFLIPLEVHHKTYARRGLEWMFPEDLLVLCRSCHQAEHDNEEGLWVA